MTTSHLKKKLGIRHKAIPPGSVIKSVEEVAKAMQKSGSEFTVKTFRNGVVFRYGVAEPVQKKTLKLRTSRKKINEIVEERVQRANYGVVVREIYSAENYETEKIRETVNRKLSQEEKEFYATLSS